MIAAPIASNKCTVYPGEFVPLSATQKLMAELKLSCMDSRRSSVNMEEFDNYFKIEVMMPGAKREEIMVFVKENTLSVVVVHRSSVKGGRKMRLHEFDTVSQRGILLPENADPDFISAEYRSGLLVLHIPKAFEKVLPVSRQVVVY